MREKLIEFLETLFCSAAALDLADYLIANGVVPVVRCKDCKHYHTHNRSSKWNREAMYCCKSAIKKVCPDDFCSNGERRTDV